MVEENFLFSPFGMPAWKAIGRIHSIVKTFFLFNVLGPTPRVLNQGRSDAAIHFYNITPGTYSVSEYQDLFVPVVAIVDFDYDRQSDPLPLAVEEESDRTAPALAVDVVLYFESAVQSGNAHPIRGRSILVHTRFHLRTADSGAGAVSALPEYKNRRLGGRLLPGRVDSRPILLFIYQFLGLIVTDILPVL